MTWMRPACLMKVPRANLRSPYLLMATQHSHPDPNLDLDSETILDTQMRPRLQPLTLKSVPKPCRMGRS